MNCPTCDHAMQALGYCDGGTVYHCPRCGTISHADQFVDAPPRVYVPALVGRCREFELGLSGSGLLNLGIGAWRRMGIAESINLPEGGRNEDRERNP